MQNSVMTKAHELNHCSQWMFAVDTESFFFFLKKVTVFVELHQNLGKI